jgi:hypothetical protein
VVFETHPYGHVRRLSRNDWWVTFAPDYNANDAAVDLDPAAQGTYGQLLMHGRDVYGRIVYVAPTVRHRMRTVLAAMRDAQPGDEEWAWDAGEWSTPDYQWLVDIGDAVLADKVAAVPDASLIKLAHLRQVEEVRLADLAGLSHLRSIRIIDARQKAEYVDLSIPSGLPVEQVHIVAGRFDPHRLAATPTLAYATLAGNAEPVAVAALAGLPNIVGWTSRKPPSQTSVPSPRSRRCASLASTSNSGTSCYAPGGPQAGWLPPNSADVRAWPRRPHGCTRSAVQAIRRCGTARSGEGADNRTNLSSRHATAARAALAEAPNSLRTPTWPHDPPAPAPGKAARRSPSHGDRSFQHSYRRWRPMVERSIAWLVTDGCRRVPYRGIQRNQAWWSLRWPRSTCAGCWQWDLPAAMVSGL